ncbi:MFS transporter [Falsiroseomonas stagni]|uniref:Sugar phosphate permease n=1 Tax=Falsiroseomonas stagni DSM 19981 TaxID=1123062 RepID=A0A1I3X6A8_9PROT|nr:MFS transporter [Falsiroseomonas stagni]SFK15352.1 Sugar phosphate permease [Falsiroseomonas stagni DSM 19981]
MGVRLSGGVRLFLLFAAHCVGTINIMGVMAFAPAIQRDLGLDTATFGLLVAAYYGAQPLVALPGGWLVDRIGVRAALALSMAGVSISAGFFAVSAGGAMAASLLILAGIAYSLVNPATSVGVVTWFPPDWRSTMMSVKQAGVPAGGLIAAIIAGLAGPDAWRVSAGAVAVAAALVAVLAVVTPGGGAPAVARGPVVAGLLTVLRNRALMRVCLTTFLLNTAQGAFYAYLVLYMVGPAGLSPAVAALIFGATHVVSAIARILWGLLADRVWRGDGPRVLRIIAFASCLGFVGLALAAGLGAPAAAAAALALGMTIAGFAGVAQGAAATAAPRAQIGAAMGVFMVLTPLGSVFGPSLFGGLIGLTGGYLVPYLVLAGVTLVVGLFVLRR